MIVAHTPVLIVHSQGNTLIVRDEPLEFALTLYNPFAFELEIQNLSLRYASFHTIQCSSKCP